MRDWFMDALGVALVALAVLVWVVLCLLFTG